MGQAGAERRDRAIRPMPRPTRRRGQRVPTLAQCGQWSQPKLSAIFCYNDLVALGALRGCKALGLRVPADIAIAGYDDIMLAGVVSPALTTCHVPREEMGRQAASMLLSCITEGMDNCGQVMVKPELVVRDSTTMA